MKGLQLKLVDYQPQLISGHRKPLLFPNQQFKNPNVRHTKRQPTVIPL